MVVLLAIRNFRHGGLRRLFERGDRTKLHPAHVNRVREILLALDGADALGEFFEPFNRLHPPERRSEGPMGRDCVANVADRVPRRGQRRARC